MLFPLFLHSPSHLPMTILRCVCASISLLLCWLVGQYFSYSWLHGWVPLESEPLSGFMEHGKGKVPPGSYGLDRCVQIAGGHGVQQATRRWRVSVDYTGGYNTLLLGGILHILVLCLPHLDPARNGLEPFRCRVQQSSTILAHCLDLRAEQANLQDFTHFGASSTRLLCSLPYLGSTKS